MIDFIFWVMLQVKTMMTREGTGAGIVLVGKPTGKGSPGNLLELKMTSER